MLDDQLSELRRMASQSEFSEASDHLAGPATVLTTEVTVLESYKETFELQDPTIDNHDDKIELVYQS